MEASGRAFLSLCGFHEPVGEPARASISTELPRGCMRYSIMDRDRSGMEWRAVGPVGLPLALLTCRIHIRNHPLYHNAWGQNSFTLDAWLQHCLYEHEHAA